MTGRPSPSALALAPALALALALAGPACGGKKGPAGGAGGKDTAKRTVRVAPVAQGDLVDAVTVIGELHGFEEAHLVAAVPERIRDVVVEEGAVVRAGEVLVTLWGDMQRQGYDGAQAGLDAAIAGRDAALDNVKRARLLREAGSIPAAQLESAEVQLRAAEAQVRQATAATGQASSARGRMVLRAPIGGVVTQITLREGDLAAPGLPILTVVQTDRIKAILRVPEQEFLRIRVGMPVELAPLAAPDAHVEAKVSLVGPVVDRLTRTGLVEVHLDNGAGRLVAGSAVRARITVERRRDVVLAPADAVLFTGETDRTGLAVTFLAQDGVARRREVRVGRRQGDRIEVVEGLTPGEPLIVQGAVFLRDGNPIELAPPPGSASTSASSPAPAPAPAPATATAPAPAPAPTHAPAGPAPAPAPAPEPAGPAAQPGRP